MLALGSPHGDDQIAWMVAERLNADPLFRGTCIQLRTPWDVVPHIRANRRTIIIDACRSGAPAGTIHRLAAQELPDRRGYSASSHGGTLVDALRLAESLEYEVTEVVIYGIEIAGCQPGAPLSESMRRTAEELANRIRAEFES